MKGMIASISRLRTHDGDGLRTTVFFKGCALRCVWCHNPETFRMVREIEVHNKKCVHCASCVTACKSGALSHNGGTITFDRSVCTACGNCAQICPTEARAIIGETWEADALARCLSEDKPFFDNGGGVTLSGGECLLQADFAAEVARLLGDMGISVYVDTCGFVSKDAFDKIMPFTDKFLYDIKAIDDVVHKKCTGQSNEQILKNLDYILSRGAKVEVRYPLVPEHNDGEAHRIGEFLKGKGIEKIKVLAYHDLARSKYLALGLSDTMPAVPSPTYEQIESVANILRNYGLNVINGLE